ncbi:DUF2842 domain-containing protein [Chelatococcus reniformis]|uniref:DUF2842 domain-containing protein n=1 Tax=Chelatococcus reniformis TaxID=1494448 RepID=A0A916U138_9HYPH|nr:DUF2842 domain-containing protein [Chelatococcus reniformis]GGC55070.1 hypothetical protein GCM10010994_12450 [Chelatococcus reniformis]
MPRSQRKLIGSIGMIIFVVVYALVVMVVAQGRIQEAPKLAQTAFFLVAGLIWIVPLLPLIRWMERADRDG